VHIIVVGAGEVGSFVAQLLSKEGHDVAVVDEDGEVLRTIAERLDVLTVEGSGTHPHILEEAGVRKAELLVAVTSNDEANLIACLIAKQAGVDRVIARIEAECLRGREAKELLDLIGTDLVIDPDEATALEILELLNFPGASEIAMLGGGEVIVLGARLSADAPIIGRTLSSIAEEYEPDWDFMVGSITRGEDTIIPRADQTLEADDILRVVAKKRARRDLVHLLGLSAGRNRRVMLLGGGRTAEIVADSLAHRNAEVTLIERDPDRARQLAERLDGVLVLEGDISDAELLDSEDVGSQDAVIALTGEDDANILACLYAKSRGAGETIAVLHRLSLRGLLGEVGIDVALSPRTATANGVLRFVRGNVAQVATFLSADIEVLELEVEEGSPADSALIRDLDLGREVLIGAIVRDGKVQIARGNTKFRYLDHVVVFARPQSVPKVKKLFSP
jgi:trk system potassium uptake protein TrkA